MSKLYLNDSYQSINNDINRFNIKDNEISNKKNDEKRLKSIE